MSVDINLNEIKKLIKMIEGTDVKKIKIDENGSIEITMKTPSDAAGYQPAAVHMLPQPSPVAAPAVAAAPDVTAPAANDDANTLKSPMVGTIYLSPSPGADMFVTEGQVVKKGDVLCLVEAMKMFNKIKADRDGKIIRCCIEDAQVVEFDQPLFIIE